MSSNASTSATITKRNGPPPTAGSKCRCCPYGLHIELGFVPTSYTPELSSGFHSRQGTPTQSQRNGNDRSLMSPLDSVFSDSLENIMSDFEEALALHKTADEAMQKNKREKDIHEIKNRFQNGYSSDYTTYRRGNNTLEKKLSFDLAVPPPPPPPKPSRPTNLMYTNGSRSNTPILFNNGRLNNHNINNNTSSHSNGYSTALAKTVSEIRARNAESPFPEVGSRVGTPIDLGISLRELSTPTFRGDTFSSRPNGGNVTPTLRSGSQASTFRRVPSQGDITPSKINGYSSEFASLRRGREYSLNDSSEASSSRSRFFSASPKLPRRLQVAPQVIDESHFTYSHQSNGSTVLSRTQATCTSPLPVEQKQTRTVAVTTGPLPPAKPCGECPNLKKELALAIERIPPARGEPVHISTNTDEKRFDEKSVGETIEIQHVGTETEAASTSDIATQSDKLQILHIDTQTNEVETRDMACSPIIFDKVAPPKNLVCSSSQTTSEPAPPAPSLSAPALAKDAECAECLKRMEVFTRNVGVGACSVQDKICVSCDPNVEETDENEAPGFKTEPDDQKQRDFEIAKTNAVKKLLTNEQKSPFQRGTAVSKSARFDRKKSVDDLDYIIDKKVMSTSASNSTVPENSEALTSKVILKKEYVVPPSKVPEPVPARIPRPKISKWATPEECAETPDEEEEAQDRLTPLRSELRVLGNSDYDAESDCSDHSDGTFEVTDDVFDAAPFDVSDELRKALENFNSNILEPGSVPMETVDISNKLVQHEWMKTAARKSSRYEHVDRFIAELRNYGPKMVGTVVNISDQNGNTALHYAVSHANFPVVSSILDCEECDLNTPNKAGYTAVMLAALSALEDDLEKAVVQRLFEMGDVNAKATQHGQTALMLAVSHGKRATTELLITCGANVNIQDEEGSTALMCAAEHGHRDLVKILLSQPNIDASLTDCDSSTALSIAVENGHRDIGVLIYAHLNYAKLDAGQPTSTI
ncbi:unnamed protein product [Caenorhabditis bovis]|uniref:Uncharacterized protein n=1 Tax=Caenorhabditis bovis TaxID=2654633 RepID=A0A8S1ESC7_9PELO|nr:unnamed protein product [Caenorhabditis bovis]